MPWLFRLVLIAVWLVARPSLAQTEAGASIPAAAPTPDAGAPTDPEPSSAPPAPTDGAPEAIPAPVPALPPPAAEKDPGKEPTARPPLEVVRWREDWRWLRTYEGPREIWDGLKDIHLLGEDVTLSVGGETRLRYEGYRRPEFGVDVGRSDYMLYRAMIHADLHAGPVRLFVQPSTVLSFQQEPAPGPLDENKLELQQVFADLALLDKKERSLVLRVGRQEMPLGSQRIFSIRRGPNVRQSFDLGRVLWRSKGFDATAFGGVAVQPRTGVFDDKPSSEAKLWGVYTTFVIVKSRLSLDAYYVGTQRDARVYGDVRGRDTRQSFGGRAFGTVAETRFNVEGIFQTGTMAGTPIAAWTLANEVERQVDAGPVKLVYGVRADITSGDRRPGDGSVNTFAPLFPALRYFSEAGLLSPSNFVDAHPMLRATYKNVSLLADWDVFRRYSTRDAAYGTANFPLLAADSSRERFVGHQPTFDLSVQLDRHVSLRVYYAHFFAGPFVRSAGGGDVDFLGTWTDVSF